MNITIVCFSQTGNTLKIAQTMKEVLEKAGHKVSLIPLAEAASRGIGDYEVLGVGTPCFESQAPLPVMNFLKTLPQVEGRPVFVFATSSGAPGRVLYNLSSTLQRKGARVLGGFMARGTVYHPAPVLVGRMPCRPDADDLIKARSFAEALGQHLQSGRSGPMSAGRKDALVPTWGFYQLVSMIAKQPLLNILLAKPKLSESSCNKCGLCSKQCPVQCVSLQPFPVLDSRCIRCYNCVNICPKKAFSVSWWLSNKVLFLLYNTLFCRLFGEVEPGERIY
jgi:flavodoxin/Pyruvate/2-oxoacid:ferredoxin oxidoreductase delta subunit